MDVDKFSDDYTTCESCPNALCNKCLIGGGHHENIVVEDDDGGNLKSGGSKMGCFSFLKKNKKHTRSTKKMRLPKWNKSRKKGNVQGDIVEL